MNAWIWPWVSWAGKDVRKDKGQHLKGSRRTASANRHAAALSAAAVLNCRKEEFKRD